MLGLPLPIDYQALEDTLHVVACLAEGNAFNPVDYIDGLVARIAVLLDPAFRSCGAGIVGGQREDIGAVELFQQFVEIGLPEAEVVVRVAGEAVAVERNAERARCGGRSPASIA